MQIRNIEFTNNDDISYEIRMFFAFQDEPVILRLNIFQDGNDILISLLDFVKSVTWRNGKG